MVSQRLNAVVVGQGYVGLPLARAMVRAGISVVGLDSDPDVVARILSGHPTTDDVTASDLESMFTAGYRVTTDPQVIGEASAVVICVPTPLDSQREPDLRDVISASEVVALHMAPGVLVVLESTSYPGTTDEVVAPILARSGLALDRDYWLACSPERIDPGNQLHGLETTPKVVGGVTRDSSGIAADFYGAFVSVVVRARNAREAETAKLLENAYRQINIALVNELAQLCHEMDIDVWEVIKIASTKPFGFQAFRPGPGVGGHCIPVDPAYLNYAVKQRLGRTSRFIELAEEVNLGMPSYTVGRIESMLRRDGLELDGANITLLGVAYKENVSDTRESPAFPIAQALEGRGAHVVLHDPSTIALGSKGPNGVFVADLDLALSGADVVVLLQHHRDYDIEAIVASSRRVFDTRGVATGAHVERL